MHFIQESPPDLLHVTPAYFVHECQGTKWTEKESFMWKSLCRQMVYQWICPFNRAQKSKLLFCSHSCHAFCLPETPQRINQRKKERKKFLGPERNFCISFWMLKNYIALHLKWGKSALCPVMTWSFKINFLKTYSINLESKGQGERNKACSSQAVSKSRQIKPTVKPKTRTSGETPCESKFYMYICLSIWCGHTLEKVASQTISGILSNS